MSKPNLPPLPTELESVYVSVDGLSTYREARDCYYTMDHMYAYAEEAVRQALAAQVPVVWRYRTNGTHINYSDVEPPSDAYDELTLCRLALIPENSHGKPT